MNSDNSNQNGMVLGNIDNIDTLDVTPPAQPSNNTVLTNPNPEPAYTNPQTIPASPDSKESTPVTPPVSEPSVPTPPVAGLDGSIGMTPPVSLEKEKAPKKGMNKFLFTILIIVVLAGVGFGTYYVLNYTDLLKKGGSIVIAPKELKYNVGDSLPTNIEEYAVISGTNSSNCSFDTSKVNMQEIGNYEFKITCGKVTQTGSILVVDERELEVELKPVYKKIGDTLTASEFATVVDDSYTYAFIDEEKVNGVLNGDPGVYSIPIKVSTSNKNTEVNGSLIILKNDIKGFIECTIKSEPVESLNATMNNIIAFSIVNDGTNGFGGYAIEKKSFKFENETDYNDKISEYRATKTLSLNDITGTPNFNDDELTISYESPKVTSELNEEYGAENISNYKTIISWGKTANYKCIYSKLERNE